MVIVLILMIIQTLLLLLLYNQCRVQEILRLHHTDLLWFLGHANPTTLFEFSALHIPFATLRHLCIVWEWLGREEGAHHVM